jgi:hypothetical protein
MRRMLAPLLAAAVLAGACGGGAQTGAPAPSTAPESPHPSEGSSQGTPIPTALDFEGPSVTGQGRVDGRSLAGQPVALWFWAPW